MEVEHHRNTAAAAAHHARRARPAAHVHLAVEAATPGLARAPTDGMVYSIRIQARATKSISSSRSVSEHFFGITVI